MNTSFPSPRTLVVVAVALFAGFPLRAATPDTVSAILIEGSLDENWPDRGVVAFHRQNSDAPLTVNFTIGGTAAAGTDYTVPPGNTITIPTGDREAWLEFAPTGQTQSAVKTIVVTLQPGAGYTVSAVDSEQSAALTLATSSSWPCPKAAVRFLQQAAFGANADLKNVQEVVTKGYDQWITDQFQRPVGLQQPYIEALRRAKRGKIYSDSKVLSWWRQAMSTASNADPLRQRVAFAFSEIMVISDHLDDLANQPVGMMNYYDMLLKGAFGNFRTLLYNVGTHPCMGIYLNHLGNEKGDPEAGTFADENFAREIMQLFSIGLWELKLDGTPKLDANQQPIASYDNTTIANMAKVMTGFGFGGRKADNFYWSPENFTAPMRMWDEFHDVTEKTLLSGVTLPASTATDPDTGAAGMADFNAAIDMLFNHPNCPPFISRQLIQKLVTSNPTPAYVGRVSAKFIDNGSGIRGDLQAVIRAILLDPEARDPQVATLPGSGKMKEPYLRTVNLARAFHAKAANGVFGVSYLDEIHFQQPLSAPSVFNFFKPGYAPAGPVSDAGLVGPEFQILNAVTATAVPNYYFEALRGGFNRWGGNTRELVKPNFSTELKLVNDVPALLRRLDLLLTGGTLPNEQHQVIREAVESITEDMWEWKLERVRMAIYLISTSPEFGILR
ncbi:MAG: hypothetical protein QOE70_4880 [Chthoniobacter sp.]|jgi:uncharacterized protein (DUF1800 family)|nr:hypothetical protein [Chthoniobacter sp.]